MRKNKLLIDYEYDFVLFALVANAKEYKLAWNINNILSIRLVKDEDLVFNFVNNQDLIISNFIFATEHTIFRLLKNKSVAGQGASFLLPELKEFDYLIMIQGGGDFFEDKNVEETLKRIPEVQYLVKIDVNKLKSKENLIF